MSKVIIVLLIIVIIRLIFKKSNKSEIDYIVDDYNRKRNKMLNEIKKEQMDMQNSNKNVTMEDAFSTMSNALKYAG